MNIIIFNEGQISMTSNKALGTGVCVACSDVYADIVKDRYFGQKGIRIFDLIHIKTILNALYPDAVIQDLRSAA